MIPAPAEFTMVDYSLSDRAERDLVKEWADAHVGDSALCYGFRSRSDGPSAMIEFWFYDSLDIGAVESKRTVPQIADWPLPHSSVTVL